MATIFIAQSDYLLCLCVSMWTKQRK